MSGSDTARAQLRDNLLAHIQRKAATTQAPSPWAPPADARPPPDSPALLVGDHHTLMPHQAHHTRVPPATDLHRQESLRTFTGTCGLIARQVLAKPSSPPQEEELQWLAAPVASSPADLDRALTLLRLRHYDSQISFETMSDTQQRAAAFDLARSLPFFDAALTAFYMRPLAPALEYELCVGHSVMRMLPPTTPYEAFLTRHYPCWRDDTGLLHVLAVIAPTTPGLESLAKTLPLARSYDAAAKSVAAFIASSPPPDVARAIDAAAVVMRVKSNPAPGASHSLDTATREFAAASACRIDADMLPALWIGVKSSLERALPPSALILPAGAVW